MARRNVAKEIGLTAEQLAALYKEHTDVEIAAQLGITDVAVSYFRRKFHIPTVTERQRRDALRVGLPRLEDLTPASLAELHGTMTQQAIAEMHGVSKPMIAAKLHEFGIATMTKSDRVTGRVEAAVILEQVAPIEESVDLFQFAMSGQNNALVTPSRSSKYALLSFSKTIR